MEKLDFKHLKIDLFRIFLKLVNVLRWVETLFFGGETCLCCGQPCGIIPVCSPCKEKLMNEKIEKRCRVCGKQLVSEIEVCSSCRNEPVLKSVDQAFPLFSYRLWRKNLLFAWKSEEKRVLSPFFVEMVYQKYREICGADFNIPVVPVPPRPGKIKHKGWDQIDELCFYLKNLYGIKILSVLRRLTKYQQKKLNRKGRLEQIQKAYILKQYKKIKSFMTNPPEEVILVDDVMTTGSTIEACAEELKKAGVKRIIAITLFIVD